MIRFGVWHASRCGVRVAAAAGAVLAACLWLHQPMAGAIDWGGDPWLAATAPAPGAAAAAALAVLGAGMPRAGTPATRCVAGGEGSGAPAAPCSRGAVAGLLTVVETRQRSGAAIRLTVLRDGAPAGVLGRGPLTLAVRAGQELALWNAGGRRTRVDVLAARGVTWPHAGLGFAAARGLTDLGRVR